MTRDLPDFGRWTTQRLKFLLQEYEAVLGAMRFRRLSPELVLYRKWVNALEKELLKRKQ